ncbi:MAG TPA: hypothetical protein PL089_13820 [Ignavibacteria bacterium]|nr:hypothetical protein [Ignavibacteriaceae bacterium]HRK00683.1 hypothetical protein [Ignavibacteria bacterium]
MKKIIIIVSALQLVIYCRISNCQDTLLLKKDFFFSNNFIKPNIPTEIKLVNEHIIFNGFLVIKTRRILKLDSNQNFYKADIYFIDSLKYLENLPKSYLYHQHLLFNINYFSEKYNEGYINGLTSFMKFYKTFVEANYDSLNIYLYKGFNQLESNDLVKYKSVFKIKKDDGNLYFIYKCKFDAAVLSYRIDNEDKKVLMPISFLKEFRVVNNFEISDFGFEEAIIVLKLE